MTNQQPQPGYRTWEQMVADIQDAVTEDLRQRSVGASSRLDRDIRAIVRETLQGYGLDREAVSP